MGLSRELPELFSCKIGSHLREPLFDNIVVPEETPPVRYLASDAAIKAYCYSVDCSDPWYFEAMEPFGMRLAPSAMILKELMWLYQTQYNRANVRGFHQHEDFAFHAPIPAGAELILSGRNTKKYTKRGKGYFIHESEARDAKGKLYVSQVNTEIVDLSRHDKADDAEPGSRRRLTQEWNSGATISSGLSRSLKSGSRLAEREIAVDGGQVAVFSGIADDFLNLHTSRLIAAEMGFPDVVVQGLMNVCWLSEELTRWAGPAWLSSGSMSASFLKPMLANERVRIQSMISRADKNGAVEIETRFINGTGEAQAIASSEIYEF